MMQNEISGRFYMFEPGVPVGASNLLGEHDGKRNFVHLQSAANRPPINP